MTTFANIRATGRTDGFTYANARVVTAAEASLFNQNSPPFEDPIPLSFQSSILAAVELNVSGAPATNSTYIVLQTDLGDGIWFDVAWVLWTGVTGPANFLISAGISGANAVSQARASGTAPGASGSIQVPLGARIRFVGKSVLTGGTAPAVTVTIKYKLIGLR